MNTQQNRWLTIDDLEKEYGFSKTAQAKWRMETNSRKIPFSKIGGKIIRYDRIEIDKWIESYRVKG